ncbi:hypothetical protein FHG87_005242 [Trinorchestia longiramus]|nr:hypothetical protein FHG87_005242 [Trinorchestia longiramus]
MTVKLSSFTWNFYCFLSELIGQQQHKKQQEKQQYEKQQNEKQQHEKQQYEKQQYEKQQYEKHQQQQQQQHEKQQQQYEKHQQQQQQHEKKQQQHEQDSSVGATGTRAADLRLCPEVDQLQSVTCTVHKLQRLLINIMCNNLKMP